MGRSACCSKVGLRRGPWSAKEDSLLSSFIQQKGEGQWRSLPKKAGLLRCGKSCRLRWMNYLRPGIKRGNIGEDEEDLILRLHALLGNRWSLIAGRLPGRTDNEIKNYWNTHLHKKLSNHQPSKPQKKTTKKKEKELNNNNYSNSNSNGGGMEREDTKEATKVYLPKPIRISSLFQRTHSSSSSSKAAEVAADPVLEAEDPALLYYSGSISGEFDLWEKVYAEYVQLL